MSTHCIEKRLGHFSKYDEHQSGSYQTAARTALQ